MPNNFMCQIVNIIVDKRKISR